MVSIIFSLISPFLFSPFFWVGYAPSVLFPIPFLNSSIISLWSAYGAKIMSLFTISAVETEVSDAVAAIEAVGAKASASVTVTTIPVANVANVANTVANTVA